MPAISVLVATLDPGSALPALVRSIDAQTLPVTEFELVVVDASGDGSAARLQQLAGHRPNVTVLSADAAEAESDRLARALQRATGQYVLAVEQQQRLAPRALEVLLEQARRTDADIVLGRVVSAGASGCAALPQDADRVDVAEIAPAHRFAAVRRSLPAGRPDAGAALLDLAALAGASGTVSAVGRYACATLDAAPVAPRERVVLEQPAYRWEDGALHLALGVRLPGPVSPAPRTWLVVAHGSTELALPAAVGQDERDAATLTAHAVLDPRTADGGHPLGDGAWDLLLRLAWPGHEVTMPLAAGPASAAVIAGRPYVIGAVGRAAHLDAGATRTSVIGAAALQQVSVAESMRGALLTIDYPGLHVDGDAVLGARLLLGGFGLPGRLVCADGRARLEAHVSSLAGTSTVSVHAGGGREATPTGLRILVDGTGGMTFEQVPAVAPTPPPAPTSGSAPLVQRLRRRLPAAAEPLVRRLARVAVLRRGYRRLLSR